MNNEMSVKGDRVKFALKTVYGLTVLQIADQLHASERTVYNWFSGKHLSQKNICKISKYLKISSNWFEQSDDVFSYEEFKEELLRSKSELLKNDNDNFLVFLGYDSYSLVNGLSLLKEKGREINVEIEGYKDNKFFYTKGTLESTYINFYIRNFNIKDNLGNKFSVGCKNAELEDIRSEKITITSDNIFNDVRNTEYFPYYRDLKNIDVHYLYHTGQVFLAINIAKMKNNSISLIFILECIIEEKDELVLNGLCSSIKCFEIDNSFHIISRYETRLLRKINTLLKKGMASPALYMLENLIPIWRKMGTLDKNFMNLIYIISAEGLSDDVNIVESFRIIEKYMCKDLVLTNKDTEFLFKTLKY